MKTGLTKVIEKLQDEINEFSVLGYEPSKYQLGYISAINELTEFCEDIDKDDKEKIKTLAFDFYYDMSRKMEVPENLISENFDNTELLITFN